MKNIFGLLLLLLSFSSCEKQNCCVLPPETTFSFDGKADGCGNFYVYKEIPADNLHLAVHGDRGTLNLSLNEQEFDIPNENLTVEVLKFKGEIGNYACDDVANDQGEIESRWLGVVGSVSIQILQDSISVQPWGNTYTLTLKLENVKLENEQKEVASLPEVIFENVLVGWLPG